MNVNVVGSDEVLNGNGLVSNIATGPSYLKLYSVLIRNTKGTDQEIQFHDAAALPADGAVPRFSVIAPANYHLSVDFANGRVFKSGLVICNSSTAATKTIGAADCLMDAEIRRMS